MALSRDFDCKINKTCNLRWIYFSTNHEIFFKTKPCCLHLDCTSNRDLAIKIMRFQRIYNDVLYKRLKQSCIKGIVVLSLIIG